MRSWSAIWDGIKDVFVNFGNHWIIVFDGVFLFMLIYFVLKTLYENNARKLIGVYVALVLCMGFITLTSSNLGATSYYISMLLLSVFFMLLFSVELKRSIWNTGKHAALASTGTTSKSAVSARAEVYIASIVRAVQSLSKSNTGALLVLSNGNVPRDILDSGIMLNAMISNQLIEGIFVNKAPLHDGALIIYGDKIQAAGCFLPLSQREFPKDFGTRHRAGIGVTEVADVSSIIVSEETGIVSVVKRGEITRYIDSESLKRFLREYYWKEFNTEGKKS